MFPDKFVNIGSEKNDMTKEILKHQYETVIIK